MCKLDYTRRGGRECCGYWFCWSRAWWREVARRDFLIDGGHSISCKSRSSGSHMAQTGVLLDVFWVRMPGIRARSWLVYLSLAYSVPFISLLGVLTRARLELGFLPFSCSLSSQTYNCIICYVCSDIFQNLLCEIAFNSTSGAKAIPF